MDIKCLRTFQAVVACGTYAKAADQLGYTQSTVTVHIKQLERDLGLPLFERIGRRMVLTQKGAEALAQAAEIIAAADRLAALGTEAYPFRWLPIHPVFPSHWPESELPARSHSPLLGPWNRP